MQEDLIGRQLGPYRIVEQLGRGGMATVYKARDRNLRTVAIKVLPPTLALDERLRARFRREGATGRTLDHANIVQVYEAGELDGYAFIAMEYVTGRTLKDLLTDRGSLDFTLVGRLFGQMAAGLQYLHDRNLIHRDIKPSNILLDAHLNVKLSDFGLVKLPPGSTDQTDLTRYGASMGTPRYMAPEQAANPATVDHRADVYALGVVLFEMIAGQPPYDADTPHGLALQQMEGAPAIRDIMPDAPETVERILVKALATNREKRFQSVQEFARALALALAGRPLEEVLADDDLTELEQSNAADDSGSFNDLSGVLDRLTAAQRPLFLDALEAHDHQDEETALRLLTEILDEDEEAAPAWVLRSYVETNWYDQLRCAENALAVAPDLADARLRVEQLRATRMPATFGRIYTTIPAVKALKDAKAKEFFSTSRLEDESDPLNDPYQCPYCAVVNDPERRKCTGCGRSLTRRVPPDPTPTPALRTARALSIAMIVLVIFELFPGFLWTWYVQIREGTRLRWSLDTIFATDFATMMAGRFTQTITPDVFNILLIITLIRGAILLLVAVGLRARIAAAYYLGMAMCVVEAVWAMVAYARGWTGPGTAAIVAGVAAFMLFMLLNAAPNFTPGAERILVQADSRLRNGTAFWRLGQDFARNGMWALAVANFRAATGADPHRAEFYKSLGIGYNQIRRADRALPALEQALLLNPADTEITGLMRQVQANPAGQEAPSPRR